MEYLGLGDKIDYSTYNGLVYLLRKFKRLTSDLRLGDSSISSDYGVYNITGGLTSVGGNFILEDNVTISSSDVLLNCFYTFYFTVVDVNLSGTANRRVISVTGDTGDNGELSVVLSPDLLESDEVILPAFKVDIVFDEHEYYTPVSVLDITLTVDKSYISVGEVATVTATVLDDTGSPVEDLELGFNINGSVVSDVTDSDGIASAEYTGTGAGWINVSVMGQKVKFFDGVTIAEFTGNRITLGYDGQWLGTTGDVLIDWGDGTQSTVNNPTRPLSHTYTDGESEHSIVFLGTVTSLGYACFYKCTGLTSVTIPDSVTSLGDYCFEGCAGLTSIVIPDSVVSLGYACFYKCTGLTSVTIPDSVVSLGKGCFAYCTGLTSVTIPDSVTSLGNSCFYSCTALIDYQLYWTGNDIISYDGYKMPNKTNSLFIIPVGETSNYITKGYPSAKLVERGETLTLTCDKPIIEETETSTITATLKDTGTPLTSKTLNYMIKHGSTTITSGTKTTDSNGQATIPYIGTGVGEVDVIVSYGSLLQKIFVLEDDLKYDLGTIANHNDAMWNDVTYLTRNTEDTTFTNTAVSTINTGISNNIIIEFDLRYDTGSTSPVIQIREGSSNMLLSATRQQLGLSNNEYTHIKIIINDNQAVISNSTNTNTVEGDVNGFNRFYLRIGANETIQFKNLKVYSA